MTQRLRLGGLAAAFLFLAQAVAANEAPVVRLVSVSPWTGDETTVTYVVFDADDGVDGTLEYALYVYPDPNLQSVEDVRVFATMVADQRDLDPEIGTGDFDVSAANADIQDYSWDDPGPTLRNQGFAPAQLILPGHYFLYLVASDGSNAPVMAVSDFSVTVTRDATAVDHLTWGQVKAGR